METLIRNKIPIACLVAALAVAWLGGLFPGSARGPVSLASLDRSRAPRPVADGTESAPFRSPVPLAAAHAIADWRASLQGAVHSSTRPDPFAEAPDAAPGTDMAESAPHAETDPNTLDLQGISISGDKAYAVVDRQLLAVGDSLGSWRITSIRPDGIRLEGAKGGPTRSIPWTRPQGTTNATATPDRIRLKSNSPVRPPVVPAKQ